MKRDHIFRPTISRRIRDMAARWAYDADELAYCLKDALREPAEWERWLRWDEQVTGTGTTPVRSFANG
jgi:hypothetical protein